MGRIDPYEFRTVAVGVETLSRGFSMARHHHNEGYATIVLAGSVTEVGFAGRMSAEAGDVLLHGRFDCHLNRVGTRARLQVLRLPWQHDTIEGQFHVGNPDALARLARTDLKVAAAQLHEELVPGAVRERYWVDDLADALRQDSALRLRDWAEIRGLRPDTVSHVFHREFGVCPKRFRLESRTRQAWREIMGSTDSLTEVAFRVGFSDLPHLSRSVHKFTGRSPSDWRSTFNPADTSPRHGRLPAAVRPKPPRLPVHRD